MASRLSPDHGWSDSGVIRELARLAFGRVGWRSAESAGVRLRQPNVLKISKHSALDGGSEMGRLVFGWCSARSTSARLVFGIEVNRAYTKGYEDDVGNRTTHYVFFDRSLLRVKRGHYPVSQNTTYIFVPCKEEAYSYLQNIGAGTDKFKAPPENVRVIHPDFVRYTHFV
ncbi:Hypp4613 [Branchiostoma lanceolatum]|uniref:alpha-N-acetylgalactosaminide alpha-2,6-sialyltransferase n=1 Tax=Branchiostoma lanceolatum TaxID=7740 RepID=A0A8K0EZ11_BRALA|nr:Hypp4613 [Branchiostoma lanceolatum]